MINKAIFLLFLANLVLALMVSDWHLSAAWGCATIAQIELVLREGMK